MSTFNDIVAALVRASMGTLHGRSRLHERGPREQFVDRNGGLTMSAIGAIPDEIHRRPL